MTSINNYESVELPIEPAKEKRNFFDFFKNFKNKKISFSVKKKHIAVTSMVLMLSAAVYVNYLYAAGNMEDFLETGKNYGDSILVEGTAILLSKNSQLLEISLFVSLSNSCAFFKSGTAI